MSIVKAIRVTSAAMKAKNVESMASVTCEESAHRRARKDIPVATGCTASPLVAPGPMVMFFEVDSSSTV